MPSFVFDKKKTQFIILARLSKYRNRVATVREKYLENEIFQVREKSGNFVYGQENLESLESHRKVREFENNGYGSFSGNLFILFKRGKGALFHAIV